MNKLLTQGYLDLLDKNKWKLLFLKQLAENIDNLSLEKQLPPEEYRNIGGISHGEGTWQIFIFPKIKTFSFGFFDKILRKDNIFASNTRLWLICISFLGKTKIIMYFYKKNETTGGGWGTKWE